MVTVTDGPDWERLAARVRARRKDLRMTQTQVDAMGGPSTKTMQQIEKASLSRLTTNTKRSLETALRWELNSVDRILEGGEPTPVSTTGSAPRTEVLDERPGERLIVDIVAGVGNLSNERKREILTLIRAMQQSDSPD